MECYKDSDPGCGDVLRDLQNIKLFRVFYGENSTSDVKIPNTVAEIPKPTGHAVTREEQELAENRQRLWEMHQLLVAADDVIDRGWQVLFEAAMRGCAECPARQFCMEQSPPSNPFGSGTSSP